MKRDREPTFIRGFEGVIEGLDNVREMRAEGEFCNDVREIHLIVVNMFIARIAMSECGDMQICRDALHGECACDPTSGRGCGVDI